MTTDDLDALTRRPEPGSHRTTLTIDGTEVETLEDLPPLRDRLLFVGLNPSPVSVEAGHYHQGRLGQTFWRRLMLSGILPPGTPVDTADDALMAQGHGITDLLKVVSPRDEASDRESAGGRRPALAEDRRVATGRHRVHLQAGRQRRRRAGPARTVGAPAGRGPGRPAVRPDAGAVRDDGTGRRGRELPAEPRVGAAGGSGLGLFVGVGFDAVVVSVVVVAFGRFVVVLVVEVGVILGPVDRFQRRHPEQEPDQQEQEPQ